VLEDCLEEYERWTALPNVLVMKYEEMSSDQASAVARIARHLGLALSDEECLEISGEYALDAQRDRVKELRKKLEEEGESGGFDPDSLLHHNHLRSGQPGQWRNELSEAQVAEIESRFGEWLLRHGYGLGIDASPSKDNVHLFSQKGEDALVWEFFGYKPDGYFVDVGAFDGVHLSNSLSFELGGWGGLCVEANPEFYSLCQSARPRSACVHAACVGDREVRNVTFQTEPLGLLSGIHANAEDVAARYAKRGLEFDGFTEVTVPAVTLTELLDQHLPNERAVDFMSIDVEGSEIDVLQGLNFDRFGPRVLLLEANSEEAKQQLDDYLEPKGYVPARSLGVNRFYTRPGTDAERLAAIRLECVIERNLHPMGEAFTLKSGLHEQVIKEEDGDPKPGPLPKRGRLIDRLGRLFGFGKG
jgi:FkbM family methyltransferase